MKEILKSLYFAAREILLGLVPRPRRGTLPDGNAVRILVMRLDRVGDMVLSTPVFKMLKEHFPDSSVCALVRPGAAVILEGNPYIDHVSVYRDLYAAVSEHAHRCDIVIDMINGHGITTALLARLLKAPVSVGFDVKGRGRFFTDPVASSDEKKHFVEFIPDLLKPLGTTASGELTPEIFLSKERLDAARGVLERVSATSGRRVIALHPGSFYPSQRWPGVYYAELIDLLGKAVPGSVFVLLGSPDEKGLLDNIARRVPAAAQQNIIVRTDSDIGLALGLIALSGLFIGNNSGLLHAATALGRPTVSFMGPTIPWLWRPWGDRGKNVVFRRDLACSPCNRGECSGHECMKDIKPAEVLEAAVRLLTGRNNG